ncbi:hypothetical protein RvVAT039_14700 [Agrobacterium vitis]|nr:hypothetical protein RvVAT039_14700 [Agrobacterium vitis]
MHETIGIIGTHRPAKHNGTAVTAQRVGQGIAKGRATDVEGEAFFHQQLADTTGA